MTRKVTVTFVDGTKKVYTGVPLSSTAEQIAQEVKKEFPNKTIKNIHAEREDGDDATASPPSGQNSTSNPRSDVDSSSTPPAKVTGTPQPPQDFSKQYPDRYTPPGMIRNSRGNLVYY